MKLVINPGHTKLSTQEPPLTVGALFAAKVIHGWHYRQCWPHFDWRLEDEETTEPWRMVHSIPEVRELHTKWAVEAGIGEDNHQTFQVEVEPFRRWLFVMFHDGGVYIGLEAREE